MPEDYSFLSQALAGSTPPSGEAAPDDPYDRVAKAVQDTAMSQAGGAIYAAGGTDPDKHAEAMRYGQRLGLAPETIQDALDGIKQQDAVAQNQAVVEQNPAVANFVADSDNAKLVQDDLSNLSWYQRDWEAMKGGWDRAGLEYQLGWINTRKAMHMATENDSADEWVLRDKLAAIPELKGFAGHVGDVSRFMGGLANNLKAAQVGALATAGVGAAVGAGATPYAAGAGALPGAFTGWMWGLGSGLMADMARESYANAYARLSDARGADGQELPEAAKQFGALVTGAATYAISKMGVGQASEATSKGFQQLFSQTLAAAASRPTIAKALADAAGTLGKAGVEGATLNGMMTAAGAVGDTLAKVVSPGHFDSILNDPVQQAQFKEQLIDAMGEGLEVFPYLKLPGVAMGFTGDVLRAERAGRDVAAMQALEQGAVNSKLRQRSPDRFRDFIAMQTEGSPVENWYIPADKVAELYQQSGVDPLAVLPKDDPLFGWLPDFKEQYAQARAAKGDIIVPAADYTTRLAGTDAAEFLRPDIRAREDAMSYREAMAYYAQAPAELTRTAREMVQRFEQERADYEPEQAVFNDAYQQLLDAGVSQGDAAQYAALTAAKHAARAARAPELYPDALAAYEQAKLDIRGPEVMPRGGFEQVAYQGSPTRGIERMEDAYLGTGEGGRKKTENNYSGSYGWGHYSAQRKGTAEWYRDALADDSVLIGKKKISRRTKDGDAKNLFDLISRAFYEDGGTGVDIKTKIDSYIKKLNGYVAEAEKNNSDFYYSRPVARLKSEIKILSAVDPSKISFVRGGQLYQLEVPDSDKLLDWDKPLSEQPEGVKEALKFPETDPALRREMSIKEHNELVVKSAYPNNPDAVNYLTGLSDAATGKDIYKGLARKLGSPKAASQYLDSIGIPGHQYLDASSRGKGEGTHNIVTYSDKHIDITGTFYQRKSSPRGAFAPAAEGFGAGPSILQLFKAKDRSTFLHESGHLYLEELLHDARVLPDSPMASDLSTLKNWFSRNADALAARFDASTEELRNFLADDFGKSTIDPAERMRLMTPFHELFARGFERYLMDGEAPSPGLWPVFARFKSWLKGIYEKVAGKGRRFLGLSTDAGFPVDVSPEVRGVMDRLLASDEQIELARRQQHLSQLFTTAEQAGMTSAEWKAYTDLVRKAPETAREQVDRQLIRELAKERDDAWKAKQAELTPQVEAEVNKRKDLQVLHYLRTGKLLGAEGEGPKARWSLDAKALTDAYGADVLRNLPAGTYRKEGGVDPQLVSELFGYRTPDDMISDLAALEEQGKIMRDKGDPRSVRQKLISEGVQAQLKDFFGDSTEDGSLPGKAMDAVHNDAALRAMTMELRALIRRAGNIYPGFDAKLSAQEFLRDRPIAEVRNTTRYARDEARAGKVAEEAMLKGDLGTAIEQKRAQLVNHALYSEAVTAREDFEALGKAAKRYSRERTHKGMDQGALEQIHGLLEKYGYKPGEETGGRQTLDAWLKQVEDMAGDVVVPASLLTDAAPAYPEAMTVGQTWDLARGIKSIAHVGREMQKITVAGKRAAFEEVRDRAVDVAIANNRLADIPRERNPGVVQGDFWNRSRTRWENAKGLTRGMDSSLLKVEQICDWLDGGDSNGPWNAILFRRAAECEAKESELRSRMANGLRELGKSYTREEQKQLAAELPDIQELVDNRTGHALHVSKGEFLALMLNMGNESNKAKMLKGEGWDEASVWKAADRIMTKGDWDFVQGVWNLFEQLRPEIAAREKRMTGVEPVWVKNSPFETRYGLYEGGYYPMAYDPARSVDVAERMLANAEKLLESNQGHRPTTDRGYTKERVAGYARPVLLSLDVIPRHLNQVITDLAYREYVFDAVKFLRDPKIKDVVSRTLGKEYYSQFTPWLKSLVADGMYDSRGLDFWDRMCRRARINTTLVGLGYRLSTMLVHGSTAGFNSVGELGPKWMSVGVKKFFGSPSQMAAARDFVFDRSAEMRHRMDTMDRDIRDGLRDIQEKRGIVSGVRRFSYYGISMLDMASAMPTWLGAYEKALAPEEKGGLGMPEADAIYYADKSVRNAHGGGGAKDLAAVQRGNETQKLFTMFYSFWSHFYNRQRNLGRMAVESVRGMGTSGQRAQGAKDFAHTLAKSFFYFVAPMIVHGLIKDGGPDEDKEQTWGGWAAHEMALGLFSGIPIVRDVANSLASGRDYQATPIAALFSAAKSTGKDIAAGLSGEEDASPRWIRHALETAGYAFGLPTGQAAGTTQYLWDVMHGADDPEGVSDYLRGLVFGPKHKK